MIRLPAIMLTAGFVGSMIDWLFSGDWLHRYYNVHPEVWRHPRGVGEGRAIAWASMWPFVTAAAFAAVAGRLGVHSYRDLLKLAVAVWIMAPLPIIVTNGLFIKLHPIICASHAAGWLVKLSACAVITALLG